MADERLADLGKFLGDQRDRAQGTLRKLTDLAGVTAPTARPPVDLADAIAHDPALTDEQRSTLAQIYASFRAANAATSGPAREGDPDPSAESPDPGAG